jgi:hypothetical protein
MTTEQLVQQDLENLLLKKQKEQLEIFSRNKIQEIEDLTVQYEAKLELCLDDSSLLSEAIALKQQIIDKTNELQTILL